MSAPLWHPFATYHFAVSGVETWLWLPPLAAFAISFFTSMVGISGAFLLVPFQMSVLGFASPSASATNLVFNLIAIPGGMVRYWRENRLFWPLALVVTLGGAPGTFAGAWLRTHWLAERAAFEPFVAAILAWLAWRMWADQRRETGQPHPDSEARLLGWSAREIRFLYGGRQYGVPLPSMLLFAFLVGVIGTAYGIGGGPSSCRSAWRYTACRYMPSPGRRSPPPSSPRPLHSRPIPCCRRQRPTKHCCGG